MVVSAQNLEEEGLDDENDSDLPSPERQDNPEADLRQLKERLEKTETNKEERIKLYADTLNDVLGADPRLTLKSLKARLDANETPTKEDKELVVAGTQLLAGIAGFKELEFKSAKDLCGLFRSDADESLRIFSDTLIGLLAHSDSDLGSWFQLEGWQESLDGARMLTAAMLAVRDAVHPDELEASKDKKKKKNPEDQKWYEEALDYCKENPGTVGLGLGVGAAGVGLLYLGMRKFFGGEAKEASSFGAAKTAATVGLATYATGQVLGMDSVRKYIAEHCPSYVYNFTQGFASFVDFEGGTGMDYWTGNGPDANQQEYLTHLAPIFGVSEGRVWNTGKLKFNEFMEGKSASMLSFMGAGNEEEKIRVSIKDFYLDELKDAMPELKNPEASKNLTLQEVLFKGYELGIIKTKDRTDLSVEDREKLTARDQKDDVETKDIQKAFDKPRENTAKLKEFGAGLLTRLETLDGSVDDYWGQLGSSVEDFLGFDFDFGSDDSEEYRDLRAAGESLKAFYKEGATKDHVFFEEKKERVKAFVVFLEKHKDEDPWEQTTIDDFEGTASKKGYKEEMLELDKKIRSSLARAEEDNLKKRVEDNAVQNLADLEEGAQLVVVGASGICSTLQFRAEKLQEGSKVYWALTIGQAVGVAYEFVKNPGHSSLRKVGTGLFIDPLYLPGKLAYKTYKLGVNPYRAYRGLRYSADELLHKMLKGEMTPAEVQTRAFQAETYGKNDLRFWKYLSDADKSAMETRINEIKSLAKHSSNSRLMFDYVDGKAPLGSIIDFELHTMLQAIEPVELDRIRTHRVLDRLRAIHPQHFAEVVAHLETNASLSSQAQAALTNLALTPEQKAAAKRVLPTKEGKQIVKFLVSAQVPTPGLAAELLTSTQNVVTGEKNFKYKFGTEEYLFKESEVATRATQIEAAERAAGRGPATGQTSEWQLKIREMAFQALCEERFVLPVETAPNSGKYRFAGEEFKFTNAQISQQQTLRGGMTHEQAVKELCMRQRFGHLPIEEARLGPNGKYEYRIGTEWISGENPGVKLSEAEIRAKFEQHLTTKQIAKLPQKMMDAKVLKTFQMIEKLGGTAMAVAAIYMMETATDKRKAVCEFAVGCAAFMGGMKASELLVLKRFGAPKTPAQAVIHFILGAAGGLAAAYKITEPLESLLEPYIAAIPASHAVGGEFASLIEKASIYSLSRTTFGSLEKGILRAGITKTATKMGISGLEAMFEKKVSAAFLERIGMMAAKRGLSSVLLGLGWKGAATGILIADDATVIGVADDIFAAGLAVWMIVDIIEIVRLILNAIAVQNQMEERKKHRILSFQVKNSKARAAFQKKLIPFGLTLDSATELTEDQFLDILRTIPDVRISFTREDTLGHEEWFLQNGEATGIAIYGEGNELLAEMTDEDAVEMEAKLDEMEKARLKQLAA